MSGNWIILIGTALLTIMTSFCCSTWEAALYHISPSRVKVLGKSDSLMGQKLAELRENIDEPIAAILVLNTISNTVGASVVGGTATAIARGGGLGISEATMVGISSATFTILILFLAEIIPKTLGVVHSDTIAPLSAYPIQWIIWGLYPLVKIGQLTTRWFQTTTTERGKVTEEEILTMAQTGARGGALLDEEVQWVANILALDDTVAADIMTPRTVMFVMEANQNVEDLREEAPSWIYSRVPIAPNSNPDEITGLVMRREVLQELAGGESDKTLSDLKRSVHYVEEDTPLHHLLKAFIKEREHLFIVKDEFGGVSGLVTLEDVLEEIIGREILDETDRHADLQSYAKLLSEAAEVNEPDTEPVAEEQEENVQEPVEPSEEPADSEDESSGKPEDTGQTTASR